LRVHIISFKEITVCGFQFVVVLEFSALHDLDLHQWEFVLLGLDLAGRLHNIKAANDPTEASADAIEGRGPVYHDVESRVDLIASCGYS